MNPERFKRAAQHKRISVERLINAVEAFGGRNWRWLLPFAFLLLIALAVLL